MVYTNGTYPISQGLAAKRERLALESIADRVSEFNDLVCANVGVTHQQAKAFVSDLEAILEKTDVYYQDNMSAVLLNPMELAELQKFVPVDKAGNVAVLFIDGRVSVKDALPIVPKKSFFQKATHKVKTGVKKVKVGVKKTGNGTKRIAKTSWSGCKKVNKASFQTCKCVGRVLAKPFSSKPKESGKCDSVEELKPHTTVPMSMYETQICVPPTDPHFITPFWLF